MEHKVKAFRHLAVFALALLVCLLAPSAVRNFTLRMFEEFRAPIDSVPSHLADLEKYWLLNANSKRSLIEAGRDLARLNSAYELKLRENASLRNQLYRYEKILNLPSPESYKMEVARVIRREINSWWQYIVIRKGRADGIREGYAVVYSGGVVGRVLKTDLNTSVVELVSSRKFRMAAQFEGEDRPVIYQGTGAVSFHNSKGEVTDVPADIRINQGETLRLVTSPLAGTFPEGIPIGTVVNLTMNSDALFKTGIVRLNAGLNDLREVSVLVPIADTSK